MGSVHVPVTEESKVAMEAVYENTKALYETVFGTIDSKVWPEGICCGHHIESE